MAHRISFYPEGNADACLVEPDGGGMLLFDYADKHGEDEEGQILRGMEDLAKRVMALAELGSSYRDALDRPREVVL